MPSLTRIAAGMTVTLLRHPLARVPPGGRSWLAGQMMRDRFNPKTRALAHFCIQATYVWKNKQYDNARDGEAALLERLRPFAPRVLMDVGANVGVWSLAACRRLPEATVHAFEIAASTAVDLIRNTAPFTDRIVINTIGLGEAEQTITLYIAPQDSVIASTIRNVIAYTAAQRGLTQIDEIQAQLGTGDAYLRQHDLDHVDMLKLDVEGAELSVLRGFADAFARGAIDLVQLEYGATNIATRDFLGDFYAFFAERGYTVGKLYPEGVTFKEYEIDDEDFVGVNYIACRTARTDLIAALRCPVLRVDTP